MSKLHIYKKVGKIWSNIANGDGELSKTEDFDIKLSDGKVDAGNTYEIRQGAHESGDLYNCVKGAQNKGTATFKYQEAGSSLLDEGVNEEVIAKSQALMSAIRGSEKIVHIEIDATDLRDLKGADYKLCFAKKVGKEDYNVVWQSYTKYLVTNNFSWIPEYQLFASNIFQTQVKVQVSTNLVRIGLGEESVLDEFGILEPPKTGGPDISLNLDNQYGSIHPGVAQLSTGLRGEEVSTPIYVGPKPIVKGETSLTPVEKVLVWFEQEIETSTMFSASRSLDVEIDLTTTNEAIRLYQKQKWITP